MDANNTTINTDQADPEFVFVEYNPRRAARGAEAARVKITYPDGGSELLWMSAADIKRNILEFGDADGELRKALAAYPENLRTPV